MDAPELSSFRLRHLAKVVAEALKDTRQEIQEVVEGRLRRKS